MLVGKACRDALVEVWRIEAREGAVHKGVKSFIGALEGRFSKV